LAFAWFKSASYGRGSSSKRTSLDSQVATPEEREALVNMYLSMIPIGRLARAEEIASAALFLASEQSSYMTGADLMDDGGVGQV
jgi:NAD(P)-dependent dehydrogenase (short-subunit alcohol dehydrogenase family)